MAAAGSPAAAPGDRSRVHRALHRSYDVLGRSRGGSRIEFRFHRRRRTHCRRRGQMKPQSEHVDIERVLAVLRRRGWVIVLLTAVVALGAFAFAEHAATAVHRDGVRALPAVADQPASVGAPGHSAVTGG